MAKDLMGQRREGETPIDDLSGLLIDIKHRKELDIAESENNRKAYAKYLLFMKPTSRKNLFTHETLFQIHKDMFGEVWSWAGEKRTTEKNLGSPPVKIGSEVDRFLYDLNQWEKNKMEPFEIAVRMHHRMVQIHPFENGNGRWARVAANIYLKRESMPLTIWPEEAPSSPEAPFRELYLAAVRDADAGDFKPLFALHKKYRAQ
jgi:Fic-DOC domain mobile mystery protein B